MKKSLRLKQSGRPSRTSNAIMTEATRRLIYGNMKPPDDIKIITEYQKEENYKNQIYYDLKDDK